MSKIGWRWQALKFEIIMRKVRDVQSAKVIIILFKFGAMINILKVLIVECYLRVGAGVK